MGKKRRYITGLDGIRAIAVIMVLAYHLKLALFKSGFLGVTVFFVLSGYLITGILISEVEEDGRDCTEEVTYLPYTRRPVSNLSGERTEADKK